MLTPIPWSSSVANVEISVPDAVVESTEGGNVVHIYKQDIMSKTNYPKRNSFYKGNTSTATWITVLCTRKNKTKKSIKTFECSEGTNGEW